MSRRRIKQILAYFYIPVFFSLIGAAIVFVVLMPFWTLLSSAASVVLTNTAPIYTTNLRVIYTDTVLNDVKKSAVSNAGSITNAVSLSVIQWPVFGDLYGELTCKAAGIDAPVYYGDSSDILGVGLGTYIGSFIPGYGKPILISGHDTSYFLALKYVEQGDIFVFKTSYAEYEYEVTDIRVLKYDDATAIDLAADEENLILYTCYPFEKIVGAKSDRLFIYAERISGPDLE